LSPVLNIILGIIAGLCFIAALYFIINGLRAHQSVPQSSYDVQRQEARYSTLIAFARAALFFIIALILVAVIGINLLPTSKRAVITPTIMATAEVFPTESPLPITIATQTPVEATPTSPLPSLTPIPTDTPTPTDTPFIPTAIVNSPNGLYLRESPGGSQELELIPNGAILILLSGRETVDDLEWQEVETELGNRGWVALDFIMIQ
jgi:hypothetical protein